MAFMQILGPLKSAFSLFESQQQTHPHTRGGSIDLGEVRGRRFRSRCTNVWRVWSHAMVKKRAENKLTVDSERRKSMHLNNNNTRLEEGRSTLSGQRMKPKPLLKTSGGGGGFMHRTNKMLNIKQPWASFVDMKNRVMNYLCMIKQIRIS